MGCREGGQGLKGLDPGGRNFHRDTIPYIPAVPPTSIPQIYTCNLAGMDLGRPICNQKANDRVSMQ